MGRPPQRIRFNAKARQSTAGGSSHKKRKIKRKNNVDQEAGNEIVLRTPAIEMNDPNAEIIIPKSVEEKEIDRRERLRQELLEASNSKMTSKKRKRMDAYIEKKLKKEERVQIFERLALSQATINSLNLQSSSTLGSGKPTTHAQRIAKEEHQSVKTVLDGSGNKRKRRRIDIEVDDDDSEASELEDNDMDPLAIDSVPKTDRFVSVVEEGLTSLGSSVVTPAIKTSATVSIGSALLRNPDGSVVAPRVVKRKRKPRLGRKVRDSIASKRNTCLT
ncbi:putative ATP-dependent RNA helicase DHR1 [Tulasnella sp. 418]|nr:putative ATP-dependent RNA helicase DHR1 [Tulasnella sp. 418]